MAIIKTLQYFGAKGNNKRIEIYLLESDEEKLGKFFVVRTKTLKDFKRREIFKTESNYSVETFKVLYDMFDYIFQDPELKNKVLLRELNQIETFNCTVSKLNTD